jgi:Zn-dependent protease
MILQRHSIRFMLTVVPSHGLKSAQQNLLMCHFSKLFSSAASVQSGSVIKHRWPHTKTLRILPQYFMSEQLPHPLAKRSITSSNPRRSKLPQEQHQPEKKDRLVTGIAGAGSAALLLAGKGKYLLGALKLTKFASLGSMMLTIGTYSMFFGAPYAIGAVGLIAVHEAGHALVMRRLNIEFSPMVFVPFVGAVIAMKDLPKDSYTEALVAFGGPCLGTIGAVGVNAIAYSTDSQLCYALAEFGYLINLFNLLPIGMMDGGRICGAISPYSGIVGLGLGGGLIYFDMVHNPIFYLVMLSGAWSTFSRFYYPEKTPINYFKINQMQKLLVTTGYFALVGFLISVMAFNGERFKRLKSPKLLEQERQQHQKWDLGFQN